MRALWGVVVSCIQRGLNHVEFYSCINGCVYCEPALTLSLSLSLGRFMSWIPLVAGSIGAVVGGLISDILVKGRSPYMRIWVLIISQVNTSYFTPEEGGHS